jgi:hypothetical protein
VRLSARQTFLLNLKRDCFMMYGNLVGNGMRHLLIFGGLALAGCVSNTGAVPLGNGEFMVTVENDFMTDGVAGAQRRAVQTATAQCAEQGMQMVPGDINAAPQRPYTASMFMLRFRCAAKAA